MAAEKPSRADENRASFARYKADVKKRGKPFYPYAMFHDTIMSLVVVGVIIRLAGIWKCATAKEPLASEIINDVPSWVQKENLPPDAIPGAKLFAVAGCTACHTYLGDGGSALGAPDLTKIGTNGFSVDTQIKHLMDP